jgi:hypothetical protein
VKTHQDSILTDSRAIARDTAPTRQRPILPSDAPRASRQRWLSGTGSHVERHFLELMSMTGFRNASAPYPKQGRVHGDGSNPSPLQSRSHDHIARIWPDRGVDGHSVADCCAHWPLPPAFQNVADRCHDGIHDTRRGRDNGHRFIYLAVTREAEENWVR